jgi:hypothetical protein
MEPLLLTPLRLRSDAIMRLFSSDIAHWHHYLLHTHRGVNPWCSGKTDKVETAAQFERQSPNNHIGGTAQNDASTGTHITPKRRFLWHFR